MSRTIILAPGITATFDSGVSARTVDSLRCFAMDLRHRETHGWISQEPLELKDGIDYENRDLACASCGARMPHAPWPTNSTSMLHRPQCGKCGSVTTYPEAKETVVVA